MFCHINKYGMRLPQVSNGKRRATGSRVTRKLIKYDLYTLPCEEPQFTAV